MSLQYTLILSKIAQNNFDLLIRADHRTGKRVAKILDRLVLEPGLGEFLQGAWKGYRKYRVGDYRIIYRVEHARIIIYVLTIDNRKDAYR